MRRTRSDTWRSWTSTSPRILHGGQGFIYRAPVSEGDLLTFAPRLASVHR